MYAIYGRTRNESLRVSSCLAATACERSRIEQGLLLFQLVSSVSWRVLGGCMYCQLTTMELGTLEPPLWCYGWSWGQIGRRYSLILDQTSNCTLGR